MPKCRSCTGRASRSSGCISQPSRRAGGPVFPSDWLLPRSPAPPGAGCWWRLHRWRRRAWSTSRPGRPTPSSGRLGDVPGTTLTINGSRRRPDDYRWARKAASKRRTVSLSLRRAGDALNEAGKIPAGCADRISVAPGPKASAGRSRLGCGAGPMRKKATIDPAEIAIMHQICQLKVKPSVLART